MDLTTYEQLIKNEATAKISPSGATSFGAGLARCMAEAVLEK